MFLTNNETLTETTTTPGLGDHDSGIEAKIKSNTKRNKPVKRKIHLWKQANEEKIRAECRSFANIFTQKYNDDSDDVEEMWTEIKTNLNEIIKENVRTKMTSNNFSKPWIDSKIKQLIRKKKRWYSKLKKSSSENVKHKYQQIKNMTQRECRRAHKEYLKDIIENSEENSKKLFSYIKSKTNGNTNNIQELQDKNGKLHQNAKDKAELLNAQFCSVFSNPPNHPVQQMSGNAQNYEEMPEIIINRNGVHKLLSNLKVNKATGPDGIPGNILKMCANELAEVLRILFQCSLNTGIVPEDWRLANIVPLYKKGKKTQAENYRPVSLTSITCKLLEHIIHSSIMDHMDTHNILNNAQHGFRQGRSCETQLINN